LTRLLDAPPPLGPAAADALKHLGDHSDQLIIESLVEGDGPTRLALLPVVSKRSASDAVIACLDDKDANVRAAACAALSRIGNPLAAAPLFARLEDSNPRVSQAAVAAIQSLG